LEEWHNGGVVHRMIVNSGELHSDAVKLIGRLSNAGLAITHSRERAAAILRRRWPRLRSPISRPCSMRVHFRVRIDLASEEGLIMPDHRHD
jgi:hypothetical protein